MSLDETTSTNYSAVGILAESIIIKPQVIKEYKDRFSEVFVLFDNDEAGKKLSEEYFNSYRLPYLTIPEKTGCKDFSEMVKELGYVTTRLTLQNLITDATFNPKFTLTEDDLPF
jgi:5S rRNA maturation endonuclease (ribonuclease M5)